MNIDELKINSYGKLKDKNINLKNGINIIYGENEKGKSTLLKFIENMLYGASKNKNGKRISDFDKYKPWDTDEFSGKIKYTLDDGEKFEVFREFNKKNPKIYDKDLNDISKKYSIDKNSGSNFFYEQTGVDEQSFNTTVVSYQNEVEIDNQSQNVLLQKIANTSSTGEDNISYKKAIDKLNKKQLDEIGTQRSQGRPINVVEKEIKKINEENEELKKYEDYKYEIEDDKNEIENEIKILNDKYEMACEIDNINKNEKIEKEKLKYNEEKIDELEGQINNLIEEKNRINENNQNKNYKNVELIKTNKMSGTISIVAGILIAILAFVIFKKIAISVIILIIGVILFFIFSSKYKKIEKENEKRRSINEKIKSNNEEFERNIYEINAKISLLEKNRQNEIDEAEKIRNETLNRFKIEKENVKNRYIGKLSFEDINNICSSIENSNIVNKLQNEINQKNIDEHKLNLDKENIIPELEKMAENEEKIVYYNNMYDELKYKNEIIDITKNALENAYKNMKNNVTPKFTRNLSENLYKITNGKYNNVKLNDNDGLIIEIQNGEYKNADILSIGTIQQLYIAFRLSIIDEISDEKMPIILDEAFAFSDDKRLEDIFKIINNEYKENHQIIIFTCTHREQNILDKLNLNYNLINL